MGIFCRMNWPDVYQSGQVLQVVAHGGASAPGLAEEQAHAPPQALVELLLMRGGAVGSGAVNSLIEEGVIAGPRRPAIALLSPL